MNWIKTIPIAFLGCLSLQGHAQEKINGRCVFKPAVQRAVIRVHILVDDEIVITENAGSKFKDFVFTDLTLPKRPFVIAEISEVYLAGDSKNHAKEFLQSNPKQKWNNNPHNIYFEKKSDVYIRNLQRANLAFSMENIAEATEALKFIASSKEELSLNNSQLFETYIGLASAASKESNYGRQIQFIDSLLTYVPLEDLNTGQRKRVTREKFNAFLLDNDFYKRKTPVADISKEIVNDPVKFQQWSEMIADFTPYYALDSLQRDEKTIMTQIESLVVALNK